MVPLALVAALATGCVTAARVDEQGASEVRLGQRADVGGPKVTVLKVLEDSRCPIEADCIWASRIKLSVRIELGSGTSVKELASDQPLPIADGALELVRTMPARSSQHTITPEEYRFALRFSGGL